jgi:[CysO sulfur-carrier protein]-S-L-cysteine hydrolase
VAGADPGFAPPVLHLDGDQHRLILSHCYAGLPDEACGLLGGPVDEAGEPTGAVTTAYPCANAERSARRFVIGSREHMGALRDAESRGGTLVGVWHSHTHSAPYPSDTDVRDAMEPTWLYVIVSLEHAEATLRCYRIRDGAVQECRVVVSDS